MKSLTQELRDREKLLRDLTDCIKSTVNLKGNPPYIRVAPDLYRDRKYCFVDDVEGVKMMMSSMIQNYTVSISETKVLGVPCQAFTFEGVLLKVLPV